MAVTPLVSKAGAPVRKKSEMSEAEWNTRVDLAMLYRIVHRLGFTDLVATHLSARIPGEENTFLINNFGEMFDEITASSLVKMDMDGNVLSGEGYNFAGYCIHSGVYLARPDAMCVTHLHTRANIAVSAMEGGLRPISQHSLWPLLSYAEHEYEGPALDLSERESLRKHIGDKYVMNLHNHGSLCLGRTIPEALHFTYYYETSCQIQVDTMTGGVPIREIPADIVAKSHEIYAEWLASGEMGMMEWNAFRRKFEREGIDYAV
jgi:ribulose-5-phosphate 4-epimerase/fuculose-1-phosphate aldolase